MDVGRHSVITGPSGAGKSTLAAAMAGLRAPEHGRIEGCERVVYVPQFGDNHTLAEPLLFNLLMGREWPPRAADLDRADELIEELGLGPVTQRMPRGLVQPVGDCGWQLSHGERSRLYLARALMQDADFTILDETLAGLDPVTTLAVLETVRRRARTLIVVSHHAHQ